MLSKTSALTILFFRFLWLLAILQSYGDMHPPHTTHGDRKGHDGGSRGYGQGEGDGSGDSPKKGSDYKRHSHY